MTTSTLSASAKSSRLASRTFGDFNRYRLDTVLTRFGSIEFFVMDAEAIDALGLPSVVGQAETVSGALVNASDDDKADCLRRPTKKGQVAVNLDRHPVKVVRVDSEKGFLVKCLGTGQKWFAPAEKLVLVS